MIPKRIAKFIIISVMVVLLIESSVLACTSKPVAEFECTSDSAQCHAGTFQFDARDSRDPDGGNIEIYEWTVTPPGTPEQGGSTRSFTFSEPGAYRISLRVKDDEGEWSDNECWDVVCSVQINGVTVSYENWPLVWMDTWQPTFGLDSIGGGGSLVQSWSGGGEPATQEGGATFTTAWYETGTYTVTVNTECGSFSKEITVFDLDLVVEDLSEEEEMDPGKDVRVNTDDDDSDDVIDIDDGYNKNGIPDEDDTNEDEDDLVELILSIEPELESGMVYLAAGSVGGGEVKFWLNENKVEELVLTEGEIAWDLSQESMPEKVYVEGCSAGEVVLCFYYEYLFDQDWAWLNVYDYTVSVDSVTFGGNNYHTIYNQDVKQNVPAEAWVRNPARADPICYTMGSTGSDLTTAVEISISPPLKESANLVIRGFVNPEEILFTSSVAADEEDDSAAFEPMSFSGTLPASVGAGYFGMNWTVSIGGGARKPGGMTINPLYRTLGDPQSPMSTPWVAVLDNSCSWAGGQSSEEGAAGSIVDSIYSSSFEYGDGWPQYKNWSDGKFLLANCLNDWGHIDKTVNCWDCANMVCIFSNAIGCELSCYAIYGSGTFYVNYIQPIGGSWTNDPFPNIPGRNGFQEHWTAWEGIYDACLQVDGDGDPTTSGHTGEQPKNMIYNAGTPGDPYDDYRGKLVDPSDVSDVTGEEEAPASVKMPD